MTSAPDSICSDAGALDEARHALNVALLDGLVTSPRRPLSIAESMVKANPVAAKALFERLVDATELSGSGLVQRSINTLRSIIARQEARRVVDEIEFNEGEKMIPDAEELIPAREEHYDAEKLPLEPANPDAHQPWLVWVPARKVSSEDKLT